MANIPAAKPRTASIDNSELENSSLEDHSKPGSPPPPPPPPILCSSPIHPRHNRTLQGSRKPKERTKRFSRKTSGSDTGLSQDWTTQSGDNIIHIHDVPVEEHDSTRRLINIERNHAFPHAHPKRHHSASHPDHIVALISQPRTMPSRSTALLVTSLGNPPPYHSTRHSAGHIVLNYLRTNLSLPPFIPKSKSYGGGHVSIGADASHPELTLWQSPSLMNVSGPALLKAWNQFVSVQGSNSLDPITGLVVLHDEMETEPGKIKVRRGGSGSARGHNGIKSMQASFEGAGKIRSLGNRLVRIGIGIGRPTGGSRDSRDVSAYVLGQLTSQEKNGLEKAAQEVEEVLYTELARIGND